MSLAETTIILMVLSVVTTMMAPSINDYIQDAKHAKARREIEIVGTAIARFVTDVGEGWFMRDGNGAAAIDPPLHTTANRVDMLVTDGATPTVNVTRLAGAPDWDATVNNAARGRLEDHLITNTPSAVAANGYRNAPNMSVLGNFDPDGGALFNSAHAWRGAYLASPVGPDPWGTRYAVNVEFLATPLGAGPNGAEEDVFVLCAGPNQATDTRFDTDGAAALGDDLIYLVGGGTR